MSKLDTAPYKGVRDFYPEDQFIQNYIFSVWKKTVESFGYEEYNASILEPSEIYKEKSGQEIVNEQTFTFVDRGGRNVTLRPEMTPTLARMIAAKKRELTLPLRWYSIPNLFRYEAPQRGRLREHWQLNIDIFGVNDIEADVEIILLAHKILINFGAKENDFKILLNNGSQGDTGSTAKIMEALAAKGITNIEFDPSLTRGQAYYTGTVFEFFDTHPDNKRSIFGGGRYDDLLELFSEEKVPAVGIACGDVVIKAFLETHNLLPEYKSNTHINICVVSKNEFSAAEDLAQELRDAGYNISVDWSEKKLGDQIKGADKRKVPYIIVVGPDEAESRTYKLKNLATGQEIEGSVESLKLELTKISSTGFGRRAQDKAF